MGLLVLGVSGVTFNSIAEVKDFKALKQASESIPSKEAFMRSTENNLAFSKMTDEQKKRCTVENMGSGSKKKRGNYNRKRRRNLLKLLHSGTGTKLPLRPRTGMLSIKHPFTGPIRASFTPRTQMYQLIRTVKQAECIR